MLNKNKKVGTMVMDLSKVFDTLNHNFHLCKLTVYGFDANSFTFIKSYVANTQQRGKV